MKKQKVLLLQTVSNDDKKTASTTTKKISKPPKDHPWRKIIHLSTQKNKPITATLEISKKSR